MARRNQKWKDERYIDPEEVRKRASGFFIYQHRIKAEGEMLSITLKNKILRFAVLSVFLLSFAQLSYAQEKQEQLIQRERS